MSSRQVENLFQSSSDGSSGVSEKRGASAWESWIARLSASWEMYQFRKDVSLMHSLRAARSKFLKATAPSTRRTSQHCLSLSGILKILLPCFATHSL